MFNGRAEEAMDFYISLFNDAQIVSIKHYGPNEAGIKDTVMHALFTLNGQLFMCIDSSVQHGFTFTPAMSLYINCESNEEIETLFNALSANGDILMPLDEYPFSKKYGWLTDQFGVSWQLNYNR